MNGVTLRQIRVFVAVARHLSFSRAAQTLNLTPPAVTMQVRELETQIGLPLFDREGLSVSLTTTGEYFLVYARKVLATLKDAEDMLASFKRVQTGRLVIGMVSTAKYFVPPLLGRFCKDHPGVEVSLSVGNRQMLVDQLQRNEVDLAVMGRPPQELATRAEPFAVHPHVFIAAADHPLARLGHVSAQTLENYNFIVREPGSGTRAVLEEYFERYRLTPHITMEMSGNETIKQAVMADMGISLLSLHTIGLELSNRRLSVIDVEGAPVVRRWHMVNMLSKILSPPAEAFRYFMLEHAETYLLEQFAPA